jgi:hypothetical protein
MPSTGASCPARTANVAAYFFDAHRGTAVPPSGSTPIARSGLQPRPGLPGSLGHPLTRHASRALGVQPGSYGRARWEECRCPAACEARGGAGRSDRPVPGARDGRRRTGCRWLSAQTAFGAFLRLAGNDGRSTWTWWARPFRRSGRSAPSPLRPPRGRLCAHTPAAARPALARPRWSSLHPALASGCGWLDGRAATRPAWPSSRAAGHDQNHPPAAVPGRHHRGPGSYIHPLTLKNGWTTPFGTSNAAVSNINGIVHFKGAIAHGTGSPFTLPAALRPATNVYVPVNLGGVTSGLLFIQPTGVVTVQPEWETSAPPTTRMAPILAARACPVRWLSGRCPTGSRGYHRR